LETITNKEQGRTPKKLQKLLGNHYHALKQKRQELYFRKYAEVASPEAKTPEKEKATPRKERVKTRCAIN
jgi:hypothetical protein